MCFLKSFYQSNLTILSISHQNTSNNSHFDQISKNSLFSNDQIPPKLTFCNNKSSLSHSFNVLFDKLLFNQNLIISLENKINESFKKMEQKNIDDDFSEEISSQNTEVVKIENVHKNLQTFSETTEYKNLKQKLFGSKEYAYQIQIQGQFPAQILKQRNFSFKVKLCSLTGSIIKNINPIKVNLGVCDNQGNWVSTCSSGMDFMKGNIEIEIHHGIGEFTKIYPRDVSRSYRDQQLNFVIYPQPSVIKYMDSSNQWEKYVEPMEVEPLIIEKICIRAKKVTR